jgi:hypothetical protein
VEEGELKANKIENRNCGFEGKLKENLFKNNMYKTFTKKRRKLLFRKNIQISYVDEIT